jgi:hypothetical protein
VPETLIVPAYLQMYMACDSLMTGSVMLYMLSQLHLIYTTFQGLTVPTGLANSLMYSETLNITADWLSNLLHILEVLGSDLSMETSYRT